MPESGSRHVYGPVASRRLGRSLGVDLVPPKVCTYDCLYCQLGRTTERTLQCRARVDLPQVLAQVRRRLREGARPDWITLAGSGEPTLEAGIGELIARLQEATTTPVAVLTNGSLLWLPEVRRALARADLVLPSLDAGSEAVFRRLNRPHPELDLATVAEGLLRFGEEHRGEIRLEVFLLAGINDGPEQVGRIAALAGRLRPQRVQLNSLVRPGAEPGLRAVSPARLRRLAARFQGRVEVIGGPPEEGRGGSGGPGAPGGRVAVDARVLELLARRPCTTRDVAAGLGLHPNEALKLLQALQAQGRVAVRRRGGRVFYVRAGE